MEKTEMPDAMSEDKPEPKKPEPKPEPKAPSPPAVPDLKMLPMKLEFDMKEFVRMGEEFMADAHKVGKEHAHAIVSYQRDMTELLLRVQEGRMRPDTARVGLQRFERAITLRLAAARQKMDWQRAKLYFKASRDLLDFVLAAASSLIAAL